MADPTVVVEGEVKYRESRKWKSRWCVLTKLSPVAGYLAIETGFTLDKESNTLALICNEITVILAFDSRETLIQWQVNIRNLTPEVQQFLIQMTLVPSKSKLTCGPARLHIQNGSFCIVTGIPPRLSGYWPLQHLRKFGMVEGKFCFEGGSLSGKGEGLHVLHTNQSDELSRAFELASLNRLSAKRKTLRKKSQHETCSCWMSSHISCIHVQMSNESNQTRLASSGSDGSACDLFSEGAIYSGQQHGSDETASTRSTCCTTLRWSSASSERGRSYISSKSLDGDNRSAHHLTFSSCHVNPYLQNYDVPRAAFCSSRLSNDSSHGQTTDHSSSYVSDILSFNFTKELDLSCSDDANSTSTESTFCSNPNSSSSNCSSDSCSGSAFFNNMSLNVTSSGDGPNHNHHLQHLQRQQSSSPSPNIRIVEVEHHHHPHLDALPQNPLYNSHYQVPRTVISNIYLKDMQDTNSHPECHQQQTNHHLTSCNGAIVTSSSSPS